MKKSNGYENDFARLIGAIPRKDRYSDCVWNGLSIEVKKSKSHAWLDLVRYCEYVVGVTKEYVITLFLFYKNSEITSIYAVTPEKLIEALWLDEEHHTGKANLIIKLNEDSPHPLNVQSRVGRKDVEKFGVQIIPI